MGGRWRDSVMSCRCFLISQQGDWGGVQYTDGFGFCDISLPEAFLQWLHKNSHIATKYHFAFDPSKVTCISIWQKFLVLLLSSKLWTFYKLHLWGEDAHHASRSSFSPFSKTSSQICRWSWQLRSVRGSKISAGPLDRLFSFGNTGNSEATSGSHDGEFVHVRTTWLCAQRRRDRIHSGTVSDLGFEWRWILTVLNGTVHSKKISWHAFLRWQLLLGRSQCFVQRQCIQHWIQLESVQTSTNRFNFLASNANTADVLVSGCQMII